MKGTIGLEFIGFDSDHAFAQYAAMCRLVGHGCDDEMPRRGPAVAEITRDTNESLHSRWLTGKRDYSKANSIGSRGVYVWYVLEEDRLYWIKDPRSWRSTETYYAAITGAGDLYRLSEDQANEWLNAL